LLENPTYQRLGDHTETLQIDYDPTQISFEEILEVFWTSHNPTANQWSRQYMAIVFYHDKAQEDSARSSKALLEQELGRTVTTEIIPFTEFYLAEDYHQKYYLQNEQELAYEIRAFYPEFGSFVDSTAAARLNGIIGGYLDTDLLAEELDSYGLSAFGIDLLQRYLR
jgi:peptide-methionine (S)-S-oxide reductase